MPKPKSLIFIACRTIGPPAEWLLFHYVSKNRAALPVLRKLGKAKDRLPRMGECG